MTDDAETDFVRQCIPDAGGGNREGTSTNGQQHERYKKEQVDW